MSIENATDCRDISVIFDMTYIKGNEKKKNKFRGKREEGEGTWYCKMNCQVKVT